MKLSLKILATLAGLLFCLTFAISVQGENVLHNPQVIHPVHFDISPPLASIPPAGMPAGVKRMVPNERIPVHPSAGGKDTVAQTSVTANVASTPGVNFDGVGVPSITVQYAPPDTNGDVSASYYGQIVNVSIAWFNKSNGSFYYGPVSTKTLWSGFGGGCQANNDGDGTIRYDQLSNHWVVSQFSVSTTPYLQCVAVSVNSDPKGSWYRYSFQQPNFNDYPKMGVWPDGYYFTFNMFTSSFQGGRVCAFDRAKMDAGDPSATQQCFQLSSSFGGLLPSDLYGLTLPPSGTPNYVLNFGSNSLNLWKFDVDFTTPANTTFTGPTNIPVSAFSPACGGGTCIPQLAKRANRLDSLADRLMNRLVYRNLGTRESLVVNHSITGPSSTSAIRWYELQPKQTPIVRQSGTFAPDATYRWMGSIATDKVGNMAVGYSVSSSSINPGIRYTGRLVGDALGTMAAEATIMNGTGSQYKNLNRWGDYSSMSVDPLDDCTFWYTTEYLKSNGTFNWSTRIASFKMTGCQ